MSIKSIVLNEIRHNMEQAMMELENMKPGPSCRYLKSFFSNLDFDVQKVKPSEDES